MAITPEDIAKCRAANLKRRAQRGDLEAQQALTPPPKRAYRRRSKAELELLERQRASSIHEVFTIVSGTRAERAWCSSPVCGSKATCLVIHRSLSRRGEPHTFRRFFCEEHKRQYAATPAGRGLLSTCPEPLTEERIIQEFPPEIYCRSSQPKAKSREEADQDEEAEVEA